MAFPDSSSVLDKFQSASLGHSASLIWEVNLHPFNLGALAHKQRGWALGNPPTFTGLPKLFLRGLPVKAATGINKRDGRGVVSSLGLRPPCFCGHLWTALKIYRRGIGVGVKGVTGRDAIVAQ